MVPDHEGVDVVSDNNPSPVVPRTDMDTEGYLNLDGENDDGHVHQRSASSNVDDQRHACQGYMKPVPNNHNVIESKFLTPLLPGATASPYATPYDHFPWWQKSLQLRLNRPR